MRNQKDDKFIKDEWFDDYCFYKLVIEDEKKTQHRATSDDAGCGFVAMGVLIVMIIIDSILKAL